MNAGWSNRLRTSQADLDNQNPAHVIRASRIIHVGFLSWHVQLMESGGLWVHMGSALTRRGALRKMNYLHDTIRRSP